MHFVHIFTSIHIPAGVKYDSVLAERGVASQGAQSHNEYVVYDPAQVLPQSHIIYVYTNTHTHTQFLSHMHVDISYTISHVRVVYEPAQVLGGRGAQLHLETLSPASNLSLKRMCVCVCVCLCVHACLGARRVHSSHQAALAPREAANETHRLAGGCLWQVDFGREWLFLEKTQRDEEEAEE